MEFTVLWNGVHCGQDGDLLLEGDRIPDKTLATPKSARSGPPAADRIAALLPTTPAAALTMPELAARAQVGKQTANAALYLLRRRGVLGSFNIRTNQRGRSPQRYYRKGDTR